MNSKIAVLILLIVGITAACCLILFYKSSTDSAVTYHQLIHRNKEVFLKNYNPCARGPCGDLAYPIGEVQSEKSDVTKTVICACPDGRTYQTDYRIPY